MLDIHSPRLQSNEHRRLNVVLGAEPPCYEQSASNCCTTVAVLLWFMGSTNSLLQTSKQDKRWKHIRFKLNSTVRARLRHPAVLLVLLFASLLFLLLWRINLFTLRSRGVIRFKVTTSTFAASEAAKAAMPRTSMFYGWTTQTLQQQLPLWVVSLPRLTERGAAIAGELQKAGVMKYEFNDAVDGGNASALTEAELKRYTNAWKQHMWHKGQQHYRAKIAIDLSHYRSLERIAASNRSAIILEDDVLLTQFDRTTICTAARQDQRFSPADGNSTGTAASSLRDSTAGNPAQYGPSDSTAQADGSRCWCGTSAISGRSCWLQDVLAVLKELPEDWEVLYLGTPLSSLQLGLSVSPHLKALRDATGTFGCVATPSLRGRCCRRQAALDRLHEWI